MSNSNSNSEAKELRKAAKKAARKDLMVSSPGTFVAQGAATGLHKFAKKKAKKGGGFWGLLSGAAKMAAELAPVLGPMLLAKHAPSAQNAAAHGMSQQSAAGGGPPIAQNASCSLCCGTYAMKPKNGADGRVSSIRVRGMDYLGTLDAGTDPITLGSKLSEIDLNPSSAAWAGTTLQRQMSLYERYRLIRVACLVEPSCPATTSGQIISYIDPDPDDTNLHTGRTAIQIASAAQGADVSQVWGMNAAGYFADANTQDYFADADGSDARLISPGTWRVLAATDLDLTDGVIGSLFVVWEYELIQPQNEDVTEGGRYFSLTANGVAGQAAGAILGTGSGEEGFLALKTEGNLSAAIRADAGKQYIYALPKGFYVAIVEVTGTVIAGWTWSVDAVNYVLIQDGAVWNAAANAAIAFIYFEVNETKKNPGAGFVAAALSATTITDCIYTVVSYPGGATFNKKKTLQDYERDVTTLNGKFSELTSQMAAMQSILAAATTPVVPTSDPSGQLAAMFRQLGMSQPAGTTTHQ